MLYVCLMVLGGVLMLVGFGIVMMLIPAFAGFVENAMWTPVSQLETFRITSDLLKGILGSQPFTTEGFGLTLLAVISSAVFETVVIGLCVFGVKWLYARVTSRAGNQGQAQSKGWSNIWGRKQHSPFLTGLTRPAWLLTLTGVILGVSGVQCCALLLQEGQAVLESVVTIFVMLAGISMLISSGKSKWPWSMLSGFAQRLLNVKVIAEVVGDALSAIIGVMLLTCALQATELVYNWQGFIAWALWITACLVAISLIEGVVVLMTSKR